jgi:hypothetical protein
MLWNKETEKEFFSKALEIAAPEKLFYLTDDERYLAYWPKAYAGAKTTLQSRNALIGGYSEKWAGGLFAEIADEVQGYPVIGAVCDEIGLSKGSSADVAICKTRDIIQKPEDILLLIEVKISVVWNWEFKPRENSLICVGDYKTHSGNPGFLRSDSMLKAIGKSVNIRVSSFSASQIPIIIIGNTPVTKSYYRKVDQLRKTGIIQGFWSVNPKPLDNDGENIKSTTQQGFVRFDDEAELGKNTLDLLREEREFFSSMQTKHRIGEIIEEANKETSYEAKALKFLELLRK